MLKPTLPVGRPILIVFALCLFVACVGHAVQVWQGGWLPYRFAPLPLNAYWTALTFLDPLAAVLLLRRPRAGVLLALAIISSDVALNFFARFYLGLRLGSLALALQSLFFLAVVSAMLYVRTREPAGTGNI